MVAIVYVLLCLIPAAVASGKGRSGFGMFLLSLVLSPLLGLVIALFLERRGAVDERGARSGVSRTHWACPACAEVIRRDAKVCKHCGRDLPAPPELPPDYTGPVVRWAIAALVLVVAYHWLS